MAEERKRKNTSRRFLFASVLVLLATNAATALVVHKDFFFPGNPEPASFAVVGVQAEGDAPGVKTVKVKFSQPIDPACLDEKPLRLIPAAEGRFRIQRGTMLVFTPSPPLKQATRYMLRFSDNLRSSSGAKLAPPRRSYTFCTAPLTLKNVRQAGFSKDRTCVIELSFNDTVLPKELEKHLALRRADEKPVKFTLRDRKAANKVYLTTEPLEQEALAVTVTEGLAGTTGPLPMREAVQRHLQLSFLLQVQDVGSSYTYHTTEPYVTVRFNAPPDAKYAKQYISITPKLDFSLGSYYYSCLKLTGGFEPNTRYRITLKKGLPGHDNKTLMKEVTRTLWFPDRPARFSFSSRSGGYLSPEGMLKTSINSVNTEKLRMKVLRVYPNNLVTYVNGLDEYARDGAIAQSRLSEILLQKDIAIAPRKNKNVETVLDLGELLGIEAQGALCLELTDPAKSWRQKRSLIVVTDLGISARVSKSEALVWVNSLKKAAPLEGVRVQLFSKKNQPQGEGTTDAEGLVRIPIAPLPSGEQISIVLAEKDGALSYLALGKGKRYRGKAASEGRAYRTTGYEIFSFSERGVYRPGDTVQLAAFVRASGVNVPGRIPIEFEVRRPGGRIFETQSIFCDLEGRAVAALPIPRYAPTGTYRVNWKLPGETRVLGSHAFGVEDYMPQSIRVLLHAKDSRFDAREGFTVDVRAEHLFGAAAAGRKATATARFHPEPFAPEGWDGFTFGDAAVKPAPRTSALGEKVLDEKGRASFKVTTPELSVPASIAAVVEIEVKEKGGRAVAARLSRSLDPYAFYLGVKPERLKIAECDKPYALSVAAVKPDGLLYERIDEVKVSFSRIVWNNVLRRDKNGYTSFRWTKEEVDKKELALQLEKGRGMLAVTPATSGCYRLVLTAEGGGSASHEFYVAGPGSGWPVEHPDRIILTPDKERYRPGETANIVVRAPFTGRMLLTVEKDRVLTSRVIDLANNESVVTIPVTEAFRPNAYVTATVIRPVKPAADWMPHRASGVTRLGVDNGDRTIDLAVSLPEEVRPGAPLTITVKARRDGAPCDGAAVVLAAVDEGVLALTDFDTPDPREFFYGTRRLGVHEFDIYNQLAPELTQWQAGAESPPGGGNGGYSKRRRRDSAGDLARRLNPVDARRVKTAALYNGKVTTAKDGTAEVSFVVPDYIGELRVMACAASGEHFGSLEKTIAVKSPLIVKASLPRFLAPGDECGVPITIFNETGTEGEVLVSISVEGPAETSSTRPIRVQVAKEKTVYAALKATAVGTAKIMVSARMGGESHTTATELAVRPVSSFLRRSGYIEIPAGRSKTISCAGDFFPGTGNVRVVLASNPVVELSGSLSYLLRYPHGCVEQTTSKLFPLLYLADLAAMQDKNLATREKVARFVEAGIARLKSMQTPSGGLAMWPGGGEPHLWGSIYACDFLVEAKKSGVTVPAHLLSPLLDFLETRAGSLCADADTRDTAAYACFVLARASRAPRSWMNRLEERSAELGQTARFHLAAGFLAAGQMDAAKKLLGAAVETAPVFPRETSGSLNSPVREQAIMLSVLLDVLPDSPLLRRLVHGLKNSGANGRWGTTQENAFATMALGKYVQKKVPVRPDYRAAVTMPDGSVKHTDSFSILTLDTLATNDSIQVSVEGKGSLFAFWHVEGIPKKEAAKEKDSGLAIRRKIVDTKNREVTLCRQGEIYLVRLDIDSRQRLGNVVIADLLPAGLEIENPRLRGSAAEAIMAARATLQPDHTEMRDDRLLLFGSVPAGKASYVYAVRAVTAGTFHLPAVEASCMYDPEIYSIHGSGTIRVVR